MERLLGLHNVASHYYLFRACVECLISLASIWLDLLMLFYERFPCYSSRSRILATPLGFDQFSFDATLGSNST